jgi:hypothetical protein
MQTTSELIQELSAVGKKLDTVSNLAEMKALITRRKAITAALVKIVEEAPPSTEADRRLARRRALAPYRYVGKSHDGMACYEGWD